MLKISETESSGHAITLKLEGRIVGPWVEELSRVCETLMIDGRQLNLDLADVALADLHGVRVLSTLKSKAVTIVNCSPFVEEQLKAPTN
jgi:hypothetical protein